MCSKCVILVLIDTWWNVNTKEQTSFTIKKEVLIDTWWNVNNEWEQIITAMHWSFNRYMVECELQSQCVFIF